MVINTTLKFRVHDLRIHLHEIFYDVLEIGDTPEEIEKKKELAIQYNKTERMVSLFLYGICDGWEDFDWKKAKELGWL